MRIIGTIIAVALLPAAAGGAEYETNWHAWHAELEKTIRFVANASLDSREDRLSVVGPHMRGLKLVAYRWPGNTDAQRICIRAADLTAAAAEQLQSLKSTDRRGGSDTLVDAKRTADRCRAAMR